MTYKKHVLAMLYNIYKHILITTSCLFIKSITLYMKPISLHCILFALKQSIVFGNTQCL